MEDIRIILNLESEAAGRMWAVVAERNGAAATHLPGAKLELTFRTLHAKEQFASVLDVTIQTLSRRPGHA
jgi:hypothetical protein